MLVVQWRASGNQVAALDDKQLPPSNTVRDLKRYLHQLTGMSPFRQSLADSEDLSQELPDDNLLKVPGVLMLLTKSFCSGEEARYNELRQATEKNSVQDVEALLREPQDPDLVDKSNWSALHVACRKNHIEIVRLLLEAGCDKDIATRSYGDDSQWTPLMLAADKGYDDIVDLLIGASAAVDKASSRDLTPLHVAVRGGRDRCVQLLIQARADVNHKDTGTTTAAAPLHNAAQAGHASIAEMLLKAGAQVNAVRFDFKPLQLASRKGHDHMLALLLRYGAEPDEVIRDGGSWRLFAAAISDGDHTDVVRRLLEARAAIEFPRRCPLHLAAEKGRIGTATLLVEAGADVDRPDCHGGRPLRLAADSGHAPVLQLLLQARADLSKAELGTRTTYHDDVAQLLAKARDPDVKP